ncbi:hypothetical protein BC827DRAFT_1156241 [Russula dissimulans]|nr:hypothetical protein BC827DRAFT_1156241 [Russula dissimulans]
MSQFDRECTICRLYDDWGEIGSASVIMIFTGIGVFLSAAKAVNAGQDVLVDLFERIENFLRRLETHVDVQPTPGMTDILVKVMAEVLFILGIATKEINQNSAKTFLKKLLGRTDIDDGLRRLDKLTHEEIRMATAEGLKATHGVNDNVKGVGDKVTSVSDQVQGVHDTVKRVDDKIQNVEDRITDWDEKLSRQIANDFGHLNRNELRQKINLWLSPPDPSVNYNTTCAAHHEGTGVWFTESGIFKDWKVCGSLLWLYGKPGSGKSVLTSAIIRDIKDHCDIGSAYMAYFFFDFRDKEKQNARALLTSILVQLSNQSHTFCDILLGLYSAHRRGSQQPSDSSLLQGLRDILEVPTQVPTYIIIDALDECPDTPGTQSSREKVLDLAEVLVGLHLPNLRLYVTSRPEADIRAVLERLSSRSSRISLHDADGQKKDIVDYIRSVVHSDRKMKKWREEDRKLVIQVLSGKLEADGM